MATTKQIKVELENQLFQVFEEKNVKVKQRLGELCHARLSEHYAATRKCIDDKRKEIQNLTDEQHSGLYSVDNATLCGEKLQKCHMKLNQLNQLLNYLIERRQRLESYLER